MSRLRLLLFVYTADLPFSSQESTYLVGSKRVRGGPTSLINKSAETVLVSSEALVGVIIKFICENPRSHARRNRNSVQDVLQRQQFFRAFLFNQVLKEAKNHVSFCQLELFAHVSDFNFTKGQIITEVTWPVFLI